ncbi:Endo-1,4-beta-xylanase A precursor [compost metagenome]
MVVYYVNETGGLEPVKLAHYDAEGGRVIFRPEHFSMYTAMSTPKRFSDLDALPWAKGPVEAMAAKGILVGNGQDQFEPGKAVTRAEFIQMLLKAMDLRAEGKAAGFSDVKADAWYYQAVNGAQQLGIIKGKTDGSFGANEAITRQDMAVMLYQVLQKADATLVSQPVSEKFTDQEDIAEYAAVAVTYGQQTQLIKGMGNGAFVPRGTATRAEAAVLLNRVLEAMSR